MLAMHTKHNKYDTGDCIQQRVGPGGTRLSYMAIHKVIERANDIFGPDGWASSITYLCMDYEVSAAIS
jgi:recombination DNA repair RAD52 pathway protein